MLKSCDHEETLPKECKASLKRISEEFLARRRRDHTLNMENLHLPPVDTRHLELPLSEEDIWRTVNVLPMDKASGSDRFSGRFYQTCWPIIKEAVMHAVKSFNSANGRGLLA